MKNIKTETAKLLSKASTNLAQVVTSSSFEFWQRKDFRLYIDFDNISQTEQDRIFNELELSVLGLFILHFDNSISNASAEEQRIVFSAFQKDLAPAFLQFFSDSGVEAKYIDQWKTLIDMRLKEYREDFEIALKESAKMKEFKKDKEELRIVWARIETITIDCLTHIRRGKVEKSDPLWKLLRKWFITLDAQLNPITHNMLT